MVNGQQCVMNIWIGPYILYFDFHFYALFSM